MRGEIAKHFSELGAAAAPDSFAVRRLSGQGVYFAGRDSSGRAALLIEAEGSDPRVPLQLAGIEARFAVPCKISEGSAREDTKVLSVIICLSSDAAIEAYFSSISESIVAVLGDKPTTEDVSEAVDNLVALFQKLQQPARRSLTGLVGELCVILFASDPSIAIAAWRIDPDERFDFISGRLRLDVKSTSTRRRSHEITFEQANPPAGTVGLFASVWIEQAGGGCSLSELLNRIDERLAFGSAAIMKLRTVVADTLGNGLLPALNWRFDPRLAQTSILFFEASKVPALRPPLPVGISAIKHISDFASASPLPANALQQGLRPEEVALLPSQ